MLTSLSFGVYRMILPAHNPIYLLTVNSAQAGAYGLRIGVTWCIGILLAAGYFTCVYRPFAGKVNVGSESRGHGRYWTPHLGGFPLIGTHQRFFVRPGRAGRRILHCNHIALLNVSSVNF